MRFPQGNEDALQHQRHPTDFTTTHFSSYISIMETITKRKLSIEEYHRMAEVGIIAPDERVELINGEILIMSPIGKEHLATVGKDQRPSDPFTFWRIYRFFSKPCTIKRYFRT